MRELVLKGYGVRVRSRRGLLVVESGEGKLEVSPSELEQVVVVSGGVSLTSSAVRLLMRHGVDLVFLDARGEPVGRLYPPFVNRTVLARRRQYEAYLSELRWVIVGAFVEAKIRNQANLLKYYARSRGLDELRGCAAEVEACLEKLPAALGDPQRVMSVEAEAARAYWSGFALLVPRHLGFEGRDPETPDPVNACLNYCYRLLYSACWRALVLAGLDPYAGFLHADRSGKESLVYDYSEMFKPPAVDRMLLKLLSSGFEPRLENGLLTRDARAALVKAFREWMQRRVRPASGEPCTLEQAVKRWAFKLASFLRGEEREYAGFVEPW
ncbi:MAG: CRISPR-associated endonuclease Cas1 [Thermofilum sp.]|nr:CRISPR-associated endonuclease Cas1 [Thermofilum sp.]